MWEVAVKSEIVSVSLENHEKAEEYAARFTGTEKMTSSLMVHCPFLRSGHEKIAKGRQTRRDFSDMDSVFKSVAVCSQNVYIHPLTIGGRGGKLALALRKREC